MDSLRIGELFAKLKPRILDLINAVGGGAGPFAPTPHDLSSGHHTGSLADAQAPQFLKTDGSRQLVGNLSVAENITIDGVDLSVLKSAYDVHVGLDAATAHGSVGVHTHQNNPQGGQLDHGLALTGLLDDDHTQYAHADGSGTRRAYEAQRLNKSILAGNGLTGGGLLNADQTLSVLLNPSWSGLAVDGNGLRVNTGAAFTWTNDHNFQGITKTRHLYPEFTDTYDLGSSTLLWRKGWLSELDAILFAQNTVTLLGGWLLITKDEGTLAADAGSGDTQINFGKAMTAGDFVLFRAAGKVEYMQVGSLVSGTTYNVTRNLDGSGADTWPAGTPFAVLGQSGQGRIELNAYDTPRLQILTQGATYNAQTEVIRIGDLNGAFGITNPQYGIGIGQYADNQAYLVYTPQSGLRVKGKIIAEGGAIPELRESFDYDNINQFHARVYYWGGGKSITTLETDTGSVSGNKVLKCGDGTTAQTVAFVLGTPIPYNPEKLYRLSARVRRTAGTGTLFVGIAGFDSNLNPCNKYGENSYSSQHYIAASASNPPSSWTTYAGYMRGYGTPFDASSNPSNPSPAHSNVRFIAPIFYVNYNNIAGITYLDEVRLEEIPDAITADRIFSGTLQIGTKLTIGQVANNKGRLELEALSDGNATLKGIYRDGSGVDTTQAYFGTDGRLYAGAGTIIMDSSGIVFKTTNGQIAKLLLQDIDTGMTFGEINWFHSNYVNQQYSIQVGNSKVIAGNSTNGGSYASVIGKTVTIGNAEDPNPSNRTYIRFEDLTYQPSVVNIMGRYAYITYDNNNSSRVSLGNWVGFLYPLLGNTPVALWMFRWGGYVNGTYYPGLDLSPNQRHLLLSGSDISTIWKSSPPYGGSNVVMKINNSGDTTYYYRTIDGGLNNNNSFAFGAWVYLDSLTRNHGIVWAGSTTQAWTLLYYYPGSGNGYFEFGAYDTNGTYRIFRQVTWTTTGWVFLGVRYHNYGGGNILGSLFINQNEYSQSLGYFSGMRAPSGNFCLGRGGPGGTMYLKGAIETAWMAAVESDIFGYYYATRDYHL